MNNIPGADVLGYGFNIFGKFDLTSITSQLFQQTYSKQQTYDDASTNTTYKIPDNVAHFPTINSQGEIYVFQTQQDFQNYFAGKAGLQVSDGLFSGEFSASYSQTLNTSSSYYYCLCINEYKSWGLQIQDASSRVLSETFTQDPVVKNLPHTFTVQNQEQFFQIFRKFGTHFISKVEVGGNMRYNVAVDKSYSSQTTEINTTLKLEYDALFFKTEVDAEADWKNISQKWSDQRSVQVKTEGGDNSMLNLLIPARDVSYAKIYDQWVKSIMPNPGIINFQLQPLSKFFPSDQATAVDLAIEAYTNGVIVASASMEFQGPQPLPLKTSHCISINGDPVKVISPAPTPPYKKFDQLMQWPNGYKEFTEPLGGFQIVLIEKDNPNNVLLNRLYYVDQTDDPNDFPRMADSKTRIYKDIMNDINTIKNENYVCAVSGFGIDLHNVPSDDFSNWLNSCGARITAWHSEHMKELEVGVGDGWMKICYTCIGVKGNSLENAIEGYASYPWQNMAGEINTSSTYLLYNNEANIHFVKVQRMAAASSELRSADSHNAQEDVNV